MSALIDTVFVLFVFLCMCILAFCCMLWKSRILALDYIIPYFLFWLMFFINDCPTIEAFLVS